MIGSTMIPWAGFTHLRWKKTGFGFGKMEWAGSGPVREFGLIYGRIIVEIGSIFPLDSGSQSSMTTANKDTKTFNLSYFQYSA